MILTIFNFSLSFMLTLLVFFLAYSLASRATPNREKSTPFECGFDSKNKARVPFSTRFFLLAVIFLVFDIEIALLMPLPLIMSSFMTSASLLASVFFFIILILGLVHEWNEGSLNWSL
uniref:NADH-ubiquinone oxidoreductase chain 3 n=1 Tax=Terebellides stroemii TaxID=1037239 RepID=B3TJX7_9ANNE|nr:NADH dehydrogenase subunit 3 [Terebellides stroemii]ABW76483.1 NADH dehydrogenase subunit 3 [Terebellides stroemii]